MDSGESQGDQGYQAVADELGVSISGQEDAGLTNGDGDNEDVRVLRMGEEGLQTVQAENENCLRVAFAAISESLPEPKDWTKRAACRGLIQGYLKHWGEAQRQIKVKHVEIELQGRLPNIHTNRMSRTFDLAGKLDKVVEIDGKTILVDHKTTSLDICSPDTDYWQQLIIESQPSMYDILLRQHGILIDKAIWDVTKKPTIKPRRITKAEKEEMLSTNQWMGFELPGTFDIEDLEKENEWLYGQRVARDALDFPEKYFARRDVPRTKRDLVRFLEDIWQVASHVRESKKREHWPRNPGACMLYGSRCEYLELCSETSDPRSSTWIHNDEVHAELETISSKDVLTNSSIRCYQTCPRKFKYRYQDGIERANHSKDALVFGHAWHAAMDAVWQLGDFYA